MNTPKHHESTVEQPTSDTRRAYSAPVLIDLSVNTATTQDTGVGSDGGTNIGSSRDGLAVS